ncbi:hypothetical protein [Thermomonas sp.]|uniref:hypothetical protein n=1 Tax=Thermomonas sp. TaxID=1971895 RepID=UPI0035B1BA6A
MIEDDSSRDHVPPKQLYVRSVRQAHAPNLFTLPTHGECNKSFQHDEDYFVNSLAPFAAGSYAGNSLLADIGRKFQSGQKVGLVKTVLTEFEQTPSGLQLPPGLIAKRIDPSRIRRVLWKIIRGLYFKEHGKILSPDVRVGIEIFPPDREPTKLFQDALGPLESRGQYQGVFDYKYFRDTDQSNLEYWGLLFWDRLIITALFKPNEEHAPNNSFKPTPLRGVGKAS